MIFRAWFVAPLSHSAAMTFATRLSGTKSHRRRDLCDFFNSQLALVGQRQPGEVLLKRILPGDVELFAHVRE